MAVTTNTPNVGKVATEYNYLDSLVLEEGLHKPVVGKEFVYRYGNQDVTGYLEANGQKASVANIQFSHYEQDRIHGVFRNTATALTASAAAASASFEIQVATGYATTYSGQAPYATADSFTTYLPQAYDVIEFNGFQAIVSEISGVSATCYPVDSAVDRPALANTEDIIILSNAFPEGSSSPESRNGTLISYTNWVQNFRRTHKITGTEKNVATWVEYKGKDGEVSDYWYVQGIGDEYNRFKNEKEAALIAGVKSNNGGGYADAGSNSIGDMNTVLNTQGWIPQVSANGNQTSYTAGSFALTDIDDTVKNLQKYRGANENLLACGHNLRLDIDAMFLENTNLKNGGIIFNSFNGEEDQSMKFEFEGFSYGGFEFGLQTMDIFSDPNFLGYAGGIYGEIGMVSPMGSTVTYNNQNATSSRTVPTMEIKYLGDRYHEEWVTGKGMGVATSGDDFNEVHFLSTCGLEMFGLNRFSLFVG